MKNNNKNSFDGETNFYGPTQIVSGNLINNKSDSNKKSANYESEPKWRSPFTMAMLSWISFIIAILGLIPFAKIVIAYIELYNDISKISPSLEFPSYLMAFLFFLILLIVALSLRRITKKQTRHPLCFNFAINGYDNRLTLEKIHIGKCPQCGGKMKYYNKPIEWIDKHYSNGKVKREVTRRIPALECKRNAKHYYEVDPAEQKIK